MRRLGESHELGSQVLVNGSHVICLKRIKRKEETPREQEEEEEEKEKSGQYGGIIVRRKDFRIRHPALKPRLPDSLTM